MTQNLQNFKLFFKEEEMSLNEKLNEYILDILISQIDGLFTYALGLAFANYIKNSEKLADLNIAEFRLQEYINLYHNSSSYNSFCNALMDHVKIFNHMDVEFVFKTTNNIAVNILLQNFDVPKQESIVEAGKIFKLLIYRDKTAIAKCMNDNNIQNNYILRLGSWAEDIKPDVEFVTAERNYRSTPIIHDLYEFCKTKPIELIFDVLGPTISKQIAFYMSSNFLKTLKETLRYEGLRALQEKLPVGVTIDDLMKKLVRIKRMFNIKKYMQDHKDYFAKLYQSELNGRYIVWSPVTETYFRKLLKTIDRISGDD